MPDFLASLCFLACLGYLPYALTLGIRILIRSKEKEGETKQAFLVAALNILEPIYTPLFFLLMYFGSVPLDYDRTIGPAWPFIILVPVLSLFLPVFKRDYKKPLLRQLNGLVFWVGLGRIVTFILFVITLPSLFANILKEGYTASLGSGAIVLGTIVLWTGILLIHRFFRKHIFDFSFLEEKVSL
jgi:hypothetical protein